MGDDQKSPTYDAELGHRLARVVDDLGGAGPASKIIDVKAETVSKWVRGESKAPFYALAAFARKAGASLDWLAWGTEPAFAPTVASGDQPIYEPGAGPLPFGFFRVPRYDVRASAGAGALNDDANIKDYLAFRESWIRVELGTSPREVLCMNAIGDSMEPTIRTGDVLLVDRAITKVADEAIYVVALEDALLLKRVQPLLGGVVLRSDNPAYGPVSLTSAEADQLSVFGRVRWYGRVI